ncbi:MAG: hypothetical protein ACOYN4_01835 [Bacteroidales bacterium]
MKKSNIFSKTLMLITLIIFSIGISAQTPPPPPPPNGGHGSSGNNAPGDSGAPIGNGTFILFALAAAYAGRKVYVVNVAKIQQ